MATTDSYQALVIGSGESGKYIAWTMVGKGHRTAVVERKWIGGSCPNIACLPSKNIIHSAKVTSFMQRGAEFGLKQGTPAANMMAVQGRKRKMVEDMENIHLARYKSTGAELVMGEARFIAPRTVEVTLNGGGTRIITGDKVFLNLGTRAAIPNIAGIAACRPMTHIEALNLDRLPDHLIVIGAGYVGLEMSQAMRRLGARVTVIERGEQLASREDADVGTALLELFQSEGIDVLLQTKVLSVGGQSGQHIQVLVQDSKGESVLEGSDLLVATGRTPNTAGVGLEHAGIELDNRGFVKVNDRLETTAPNVWAMGDCAGSPLFTHVAYDDFRIVRDNLNGGHRTTRNRLIPFCMFTDPELARVGISESEARDGKVEYRLVKMPMSSVLRMRTLSELRGFMKMLIETESDRILGFTAFGTEATELMATVQTAMLGDLPYTVLRDAIFAHPTTAEGLEVLLRGVPARQTQKAA